MKQIDIQRMNKIRMKNPDIQTNFRKSNRIESKNPFQSCQNFIDNQKQSLQ